MANQKNLGSPTGLAPRWQLVRVTHGPPTWILSFWDGFWGLEGATGVRLQCFWSQKNGIYAHKHLQPKNNFFSTPIFRVLDFLFWAPGGPWGPMDLI
jgi:hypothetical protein